MDNAIDLFPALGRRLIAVGRGCGMSEEAADRSLFSGAILPEALVGRACRENGWFSPTDIARAVTTIARDMLHPDRLTKWLARYPLPVLAPRRVLVVMAGNIPLVGFFDLLCVVASGHRCLVKPSAKDRVLVEWIVGLLREIDPYVPIEFYDDNTSGASHSAPVACMPADTHGAPADDTHGTPADATRIDAVIATGSDNANRYFRARYAGIPALLRGHRQSVAVLSGSETPEQLTGLADDIWAYSGLGCRSVSLIFMPEGYDLQLQMPAMSKKYRNNYRQQKALLAMSDLPFADFGAAVAVEQRAFPMALSRIDYSYYKSLEEVEAWLAAHDDRIQCVVSRSVAHDRRVDFGAAQSPALTDYADRRDVMDFLVKLP